MIGAGAAVLGVCAGLALLVEGPATALLPGDIVVSDHLTAAYPTEELAKVMSPRGFADSPASLARMTQASCKAIAPDTQLVVVILMESGVMRVQPAGGFFEPLLVLARDFVVVRRPT